MLMADPELVDGEISDRCFVELVRWISAKAVGPFWYSSTAKCIDAKVEIFRPSMMTVNDAKGRQVRSGRSLEEGLDHIVRVLHLAQLRVRHGKHLEAQIAFRRATRANRRGGLPVALVHEEGQRLVVVDLR